MRNFDPSINMALVNRGYLHRTNIAILVNSSLKAIKKKLTMVILKIQVSDPGLFGPSCFISLTLLVSLKLWSV